MKRGYGMMNRLLAVLVLVFATAMPLMADTWTDPDTGYTWTYRINGDTAEIYKSSSSAAISPSPIGAVTIPLALGGKSVTSIGDYAFRDCSGMTSILIPASVMSVGNWAFSQCSGLTSVHITDIAAWCEILFKNYDANPLSYAHNLYLNGSLVTDLEIPASVTRIGDRAFFGCSALVSVTIHTNVTSIGAAAFYGCSGFVNLSIPASVTNIGGSAFSYCSGLTSIIVSPAKGLTVGSYAFDSCNQLGAVMTTDLAAWCEIEFADSAANPLTSAHNLYTSKLLKELVVPDGVGKIGSYAFCGCSNFTEVEMPDSITNVGNSAFSDCNRLTSVTIPSSVTSIGESVFYCCSGLKSMAIPDKVTIIRDNVFYYCSSLTNVTIPGKVTIIGAHAFHGCSSLTSVTIPDNVISIGDSAFCNCYDLMSVVIPDNVTNIGNNVFYDCSSLASVTIPDGVTGIGDYAFYHCKLKRVVVPASVKSIGAKAFSTCKSLTAVYLLGSVPPTTGGDIYSGASKNLTTYVPEGSKGWLFPDMSVLPETWPTGDYSNGRAIAFWLPILVDIELDANGGEVCGGQGITRLVGFEVDMLPSAVRDGYAFLGWFTDREAGEKVTTNTVVTADMTTLYAHWGDKPEIETGGNTDWTQETDGSWRSGAIGGSETTWMETTVYGEGEISFRWKVSSYSYYGKLYFYIDGVQRDSIGGEIGWTDKTFVVSGKGSHTLRWVYSKTSSYTSGSDCGWVNAVAWTPYVECTVTFDANGGSLRGAAATRSVYKGQAVGELPMPMKDGFMFMGWWSAGGERVTAETVVAGTLPLTARWEVNPFIVGAGSNWTQDGDGSWKSGVTAHNATNSITMSVVGTGTIAFDWKASCESFYRTYRLDYLAFLIDGVEQGFINGETDWISAMFDVVSTGDHTLTWSYIKDSEGVVGQDCAWLRGVTWTPSAEAGLAAWLAERNLTAKATAANGRKVWECYVVGLDPEIATNDFKITSFPMKADGTPDLENIAVDPPKSQWNVPGARAVVKGAATLDGEWKAVEGASAAEKAAMRFFKVVVEAQ